MMQPVRLDRLLAGAAIVVAAAALVLLLALTRHREPTPRLIAPGVRRRRGFRGGVELEAVRRPARGAAVTFTASDFTR